MTKSFACLQTHRIHTGVWFWHKYLRFGETTRSTKASTFGIPQWKLPGNPKWLERNSKGSISDHWGYGQAETFPDERKTFLGKAISRNRRRTNSVAGLPSFMHSKMSSSIFQEKLMYWRTFCQDESLKIPLREVCQYVPQNHCTRRILSGQHWKNWERHKCHAAKTAQRTLHKIQSWELSFIRQD